jgi:hypothetical protein
MGTNWSLHESDPEKVKCLEISKISNIGTSL